MMPATASETKDDVADWDAAPIERAEPTRFAGFVPLWWIVLGGRAQAAESSAHSPFVLLEGHDAEGPVAFGALFNATTSAVHLASWQGWGLHVLKLDPFAPATAKLMELAELPPFWNGSNSEPPTKEALDSAGWVLTQLRRDGMVPDQVLASPEGDITFYFLGTKLVNGTEHAVAVALQGSSDGSIVFELADRTSRTVTLRELARTHEDFQGAAGEARSFLGLN
jgi:hypothetical protein